MLLSLLSIGLLGASLISGNIDNQNAYVPLDQSYFELYKEDLSSGDYDSIDFGDLQSFDESLQSNSFNFRYTIINGFGVESTVSTYVYRLSFDKDTGSIGINQNSIGTGPLCIINFYTGEFKFVGAQDLLYVKFTDFSSTVAYPGPSANVQKLYDIVSDYLFNSQSIVISTYYLNNRNFTNLASYTSTLTGSVLNNIFCKCPQILTQNEYDVAERSNLQITGCLLFYDDYVNQGSGNIFFVDDVNNDYYGFWGYNALTDVDEGKFVFPYDIEIIILDNDIYNNFYRYYLMDIEGGNIPYGSDVFTFNNQFNYNAPYGYSVDSSLIADVYFTDHVNDTPYVDKRIDVPIFKSNNISFKALIFRYSNAYAQFYYDGSNQYPIVCSQGGYGYFSELYYVPSDGSAMIKVCERVFSVFTYTDIHSYIDNQVIWVNPSYNRLVFTRKLTNTDMDLFTMFNQGGVGFSEYGNLDLSEAYTLIDNGFRGLTSLLSIYILPGISLGLLIIIPLAITLLMFVIKLFKR